MCEFCMAHGEGKKWYLQAKHYSDELVNEERKLMLAGSFEVWRGEDSAARMSEQDKLSMTDPDTTRAAALAQVEEMKKIHYGQVVPLEEIEQILDMDISVVRLPCFCRILTCGDSNARYCFGLTSIWQTPEVVGQYPDWSGDMEVLTNEEAKKANQKLDRNGVVHTVWTFNTPFIAWICNCTARECLALKTRLRTSVPTLFKAEYVGSIDWESCNGCRDCMKNCNFGAIYHSPLARKCYINQFQCYGCGVCRAVCPTDAISLRDRNAIPALAKDW